MKIVRLYIHLVSGPSFCTTYQCMLNVNIKKTFKSIFLNAPPLIFQLLSLFVNLDLN